MIPSEHREKALGLLERAAEHSAHSAARLAMLAEAQVHATLSLREAPEPAVVTVQAPELSLDEYDEIVAALRSGERPAVVGLAYDVAVDTLPGGVLRLRREPPPGDLAPVPAPEPEPVKKTAPKRRTTTRKPAQKKEAPKDEA